MDNPQTDTLEIQRADVKAQGKELAEAKAQAAMRQQQALTKVTLAKDRPWWKRVLDR